MKKLNKNRQPDHENLNKIRQPDNNNNKQHLFYPITNILNNTRHSEHKNFKHYPSFDHKK